MLGRGGSGYVGGAGTQWNGKLSDSQKRVELSEKVPLRPLGLRSSRSPGPRMRERVAGAAGQLGLRRGGSPAPGQCAHVHLTSPRLHGNGERGGGLDGGAQARAGPSGSGAEGALPAELFWSRGSEDGVRGSSLRAGPVPPSQQDQERCGLPAAIAGGGRPEWGWGLRRRPHRPPHCSFGRPKPSLLGLAPATDCDSSPPPPPHRGRPGALLALQGRAPRARPATCGPAPGPVAGGSRAVAPRCHRRPPTPLSPRPPSSCSGTLSGPLPGPRSCPAAPARPWGRPRGRPRLSAHAHLGPGVPLPSPEHGWPGGGGAGSGARRALPATAAAAAVSHPLPGRQRLARTSHTRAHPRAHPGAQPAVPARMHPRALVPSPHASSRNAGKAHSQAALGSWSGSRSRPSRMRMRMRRKMRFQTLRFAAAGQEGGGLSPRPRLRLPGKCRRRGAEMPPHGPAPT